MKQRSSIAVKQSCLLSCNAPHNVLMQPVLKGLLSQEMRYSSYLIVGKQHLISASCMFKTLPFKCNFTSEICQLPVLHVSSFHSSRCRVSLFIFSFFIFIFPSAVSFPALYPHLLVQHVSCFLHPPTTSLPCRLVEACLECTVSRDYFSPSPSLPPLPLHAGGALLNRLLVSRGIASQRQGHSGTAHTPTFSPRAPFLYYLYS